MGMQKEGSDMKSWLWLDKDLKFPKVKGINDEKPFMIEGDEFCKFEKMVLDQVALGL